MGGCCCEAVIASSSRSSDPREPGYGAQQMRSHQLFQIGQCGDAQAGVEVGHE